MSASKRLDQTKTGVHCTLEVHEEGRSRSLREKSVCYWTKEPLRSMSIDEGERE